MGKCAAVAGWTAFEDPPGPEARASLDHLVGAGEQGGRQRDAERRGGARVTTRWNSRGCPGGSSSAGVPRMI